MNPARVAAARQISSKLRALAAEQPPFVKRRPTDMDPAERYIRAAEIHEKAAGVKP